MANSCIFVVYLYELMYQHKMFFPSLQTEQSIIFDGEFFNFLYVNSKESYIIRIIHN